MNEQEARAEAERLHAILGSVRAFATKERDGIRGQYGAGSSTYAGYANACDDILGLLDGMNPYPMTDQEARHEREAFADDIHHAVPLLKGRPVDRLHVAEADTCWALADALITAGYRKHPEPEWEHGVVNPATGRIVNNGDYIILQTHRRTKAGPWEPIA